MEAILPLLAMFGLMWLLLIRPQQRRMRQHQAIVSALKPGDEVITAGGLHGTITEVEDDTVLVEISPEVIVRVLSGAISQRLIPPEELDRVDDDEDDQDDDEDTSGDAADDTASKDTASKDAATDSTSNNSHGGATTSDGTAAKPGRHEAAGDDQP